MKTIAITIPTDAIQHGELLEDYRCAPWRLNQDILLISLSSGISISVGWFPEYEAEGDFVVAASRPFEVDPIQEYRLGSPAECVRFVESMAELFSREQVRLADSDSCTDSIETKFENTRPPLAYA